MYKVIYSVLLSAATLLGQEQTSDFANWDLSDAETTEVFLDGQAGLNIKGSIYLMDADFKNGIIEVDINFANKRFFPAVAFHVQDTKQDFEHFYVRPHQSGNPDANQYSPVFDGTSGWQLYHGPEFASPVVYEFDKWHRLKFDVRGERVKIYFDDMTKPIVDTRLLGGFDGGGFALKAVRTDVAFANFRYEKRSETTFPDPLPQSRELPPNIIREWSVSQVVNDSMFVSPTLPKKDLNALSWKEESVEYTGSLNLSRGRLRTQGNNTVLMKKTIRSNTNQIKKLDFGFSDQVTVFLNGKAIFSGRDNFRSRDYRYLGTIGFFDTVHLDLKKGENELIFVVTEAFGGWGLQAKFQDQTDISL